MRLGTAIPALLAAASEVRLPDLAAWRKQIEHWRSVLPNDCEPATRAVDGPVDAYALVEALAEHLPGDELVFVDTGGNLTWTCNGLALKSGQRLISAWNNTPMGYALPAAIGAAVACPDRTITCIIGDGGLLVCLAELATLVRHQLKVRVLVFDNKGHGIQKQTLETWLDGRYVGVDSESGLALPPLGAVARAIGLPVVEIPSGGAVADGLADVYGRPGPVVCHISIRPDQKLHPVLKFGASLEDQLPSLDPDLIRREMIVAPLASAANAGGGTPGV